MQSPRIVLVRPKEPANMGAAARAMKNFGCENLFIVAPQRPINKRAYALASHAGDVLAQAVVCETLAEALTGCQVVLGTTARPRASAAEVYTPREAAERNLPVPTALLFGPEDYGLSNEDLLHCQGYIQIPTSAYASLNLAQAVQIVLYEWFLQGLEQAPLTQDAAPALAPREQLEAMYTHLLRALHQIGYTDAQREQSAAQMFRGIFDRAALSEREVAAVRGVWRQVLWATKHLRPAEDENAKQPE